MDWLNQDQRASYSESSQIFEAPETPAPLFAYRALKSVLFGFYDNDENDDENQKDGIPLQTRSGQGSSKFESVPPKPASLLTPQKPIPRRVLSPAKSILRTPGLPTPRRRNVSVKFTDLKHASMHVGAIAKEAVTGDKAVLQSSKHSSIRVTESHASSGQTAEMAVEPLPDSEPTPETYYNVGEIDAYIAATERDMKKLVRYGQRMREYARLSQKENATLKREMEKLKEENATLRHRRDPGSSQNQPGQTADLEGLFKILPPSRHATDTAAQKPPDDKPKRTPRLSEGQDDNGQREAAGGGTAKEHSPPKPTKNTIEDISVSLQPNIAGRIERKPVVDLRPADYARTATRSQLPPERLAAAKARLRVKSEERRKTLSMAAKIKEDHGSSVVDWQNL